MYLPNKVTPYRASVISLFPAILTALHEEQLSPSALFSKCKANAKSLPFFTDTILCLYALGMIEFDETLGVLTYVNRD